MAALDELKEAIIEKQGIILNGLTELPYKELMKLLASLSAMTTVTMLQISCPISSVFWQFFYTKHNIHFLITYFNTFNKFLRDCHSKCVNGHNLVS